NQTPTVIWLFLNNDESDSPTTLSTDEVNAYVLRFVQDDRAKIFGHSQPLERSFISFPARLPDTWRRVPASGWRSLRVWRRLLCLGIRPHCLERWCGRSRWSWRRISLGRGRCLHCGGNPRRCLVILP